MMGPAAGVTTLGAPKKGGPHFQHLCACDVKEGFMLGDAQSCIGLTSKISQGDQC